MESYVEQDFEAVGSGASETHPNQCSGLRKNGHVLLKGRPCKIVDMTTSKTGKHGHAKVHLTGIDIFTGKKYEDICPSTHNMDVPNVVRKDLQILDISDGFVNLLNDDGTTREDLRVPEGELGKEMASRLEKGEEFMVTILKAMGEEQIVGIKTMAGGGRKRSYFMCIFIKPKYLAQDVTLVDTAGSVTALLKLFNLEQRL